MIDVGGLDPSSAATGVAWPDDTFSTIRTRMPAHPKGTQPRAVDRAQRLQDIERGFVNESRRHPPRAILWIVEGYSLAGARGYASAYVAEVGGVLRLRLFEAGAREIIEVPPSTVKKYATGNGGKQTDKAAMENAARSFLGLVSTSRTPRNDNEADAFWLRRIGIELVEGPVLTGDKTLDKARADILARYAHLVKGLA